MILANAVIWARFHFKYEEQWREGAHAELVLACHSRLDPRYYPELLALPVCCQFLLEWLLKMCLWMLCHLLVQHTCVQSEGGVWALLKKNPRNCHNKYQWTRWYRVHYNGYFTVVCKAWGLFLSFSPFLNKLKVICIIPFQTWYRTMYVCLLWLPLLLGFDVYWVFMSYCHIRNNKTPHYHFLILWPLYRLLTVIHGPDLIPRD